MTVEEMQVAKRQAEAAIHEAVQKFMNSTGLLVEDVRIGFIDSRPVGAERPTRYVSSVTLDVRL